MKKIDLIIFLFTIMESFMAIQDAIHKDLVSFVECLSKSEYKIFTECLHIWENKYTEEDLIKAFTEPYYNWYYGNIIHGIILACFQDFIIHPSDCNVSKFCPSEEQIEDALNVIRYIVETYRINKRQLDYYDDTPLQTLEYTLRKTKVQVPEYVYDSAKKFYEFLEILD